MSNLTPDFLEQMKARIAEARKTIKVVETCKALQECVDGTRELTKEQLKAAEILLRKSMPDLKAVEITGKDGGAVQVETILIRAVDAANDRPPSQSI